MSVFFYFFDFLCYNINNIFLFIFYMNLFLYQITYLIIAVGYLIFAIFFLQEKRKTILNYKAHIFFILINLSIAIWAAGRYILLITSSENIALLWARILTFAGSLVYVLFFHFIWIILIGRKKNNFLIKLFYIFVAFVGVMSLLDFFFDTNFLVSSVSPKSIFPWYENPGSFYFVLIIFDFLIVFYYILILIFLSYKKKSKIILQALFLILVVSLGFLGAETTRFLIYNINIDPFGVPLIILQLLIITYYLIRYQFYGFRIIVRNIYANISVSLFSFLLFFSGFFIISHYFKSIYSESSVFLVVILSLIFTIFLGPIIGKISRFNEVLLFRKFNLKNILKKILFKLNNADSLKKIVEELSENIQKFLEVKDVYIFVLKDYINKKKNFSFFNGVLFNKKNIDFSKKPFREFLNQREIIVYQNMMNINKKISKIINQENIKIFAPLSANGKILGAVVLGEKITKNDYTLEDVEFLEILTIQAASVINKNLLLKKKEVLNKKLQKKTKEQKKILKKQADHLQKILKMRFEFLDIASHQLRTPVTAISGALSMLLDGSIKDSKKEKEFLKICFEKSKKLTDIIDDILKVSTMNDEKIKLNLTPLDIKKLLTQIFNNKKESAEKKKLKFLLDLPPKKSIKVISDSRYLEEAIVNLINNSIQYTKKGFIKIQLEEDEVQKKAFVRIIDSGIGIPEEDRKKLFKKFSRARNADSAFTNGSGLGLFIVKQIANSQKGMEVYIEDTEIGKGTTITLEIPLVN